MKIVLTELYIILVYEKFYFFLFISLSMDQKVVLCDCAFENCFVYEKNVEI